MRRLLLLILALATLLPSLASGYDVLVLQSRSDQAFNEVLEGFRFGQKSSLRSLVLTDYADIDVVRIVREDHPRLILAVGDAALNAARKVKNVPVLAVMALGINTASAVQHNLTGISMFTAPEGYIKMFQKMNVRRVGVILNPARSGWYLSLARQAAQQAGIELVVREVSTPRETAGKLSSMAGKVDALWMLPDTTAVTRETTEAYLHFGQENSVPVVSFASGYLGLGATAAVDIDRVSLGHQADLLAAKILDGEAIGGTPVFPKHTTVRVNENVLKRLGLTSAVP